MTQHVTLLPSQQYMDKYQLDASGVTPIANPVIKEQLGFHSARPAADAAVLTREVAHGD